VPELTCTCAACGRSIDLEQDSDSQRMPCACGGTTRTYHQVIQASVGIRADLGLRARLGSRKNNNRKKYPNQEVRIRPTVTKATGQRSVEHRVIDHQNNRYRKTIKDAETGEVIYRCDEPLTAHTGRGDARKP